MDKNKQEQGTRYLHYWYSNTGLKIQDFSAAKQKILSQQLSDFREKRLGGSMVLSGDTKEAIVLLNELSSEKISDNLFAAMEKVFSAPPTASASAGIGDSSFASIGNTGQSRKQAAAVIGNLAAAIVPAHDAAQNAVNEITRDVEKIYPNIVRMALNYKMNNPIGDQDLEKIFQDAISSGTKYLTIENTKSTSKKELEIANELIRLRQLVDLIPQISNVKVRGLRATYSRTGRKNTNITTRSQLLAVMLGKIGGHLNYLGGIAEEIAAFVGYQEACKEFFSELNLTIAHTGLDVKNDPKQDQETKQESISYTQKKNDVSIIVKDKNVEVSYGLSVKKISKAKKYENSAVAKIHSETNVWAALSALMNQGLVNSYYVFNLAASHESKKQTGLVDAWKDLVHYALTAQFLNYLAGQGTQGDNVLAVVVNRQLMPVNQIIAQSITNPNALIFSGGKVRHIYRDLNWWRGKQQRNEIDAMTRSAEAQEDIRQKMAATKVNISLNFSALNLL